MVVCAQKINTNKYVARAIHTRAMPRKQLQTLVLANAEYVSRLCQ